MRLRPSLTLPLSCLLAFDTIRRMNRFEFSLNISPERYLDYYRGLVQHVVVQSTGGRTLQFPASLLRKFITPDGIQGDFVLTCDADFKNPELRRALRDE